jgi:hypothetical protein
MPAFGNNQHFLQKNFSWKPGSTRISESGRLTLSAILTAGPDCGPSSQTISHIKNNDARCQGAIAQSAAEGDSPGLLQNFSWRVGGAF